MSDEATTPEPRTRSHFQRRDLRPRLAPDKLKRQGLITSLALSLMGGKDPAMEFLNGFDAALGGRPLEVATETPAGFSAVMTIMERRAIKRQQAG